VAIPQEGGVALGDIVWAAAEAYGTGTEARGVLVLLWLRAPSSLADFLCPCPDR